MNIVLKKSRQFAKWVYNLYKYLCDEKYDYELSKQPLNPSTSTGINLNEVQYSVNRNESLVKATISSKGCTETKYWLNLPQDTDLLNSTEYNSIISDCKETLRLLAATRKTLEQLAKSR